MTKSWASKWVIALALAVPSSALAVPFVEVGDAGSTIPGAQNLGTISGPNTITGNLAPAAFAPYDADIYSFVVTTIGPPRPVYISTFPGTTPYTGGGTLDTMLQLYDGAGKGIVANDDIITGYNTDSYLTALLPAGTYYLAISGFQYLPQDVFNRSIFPLMNGSGLAPSDPLAGPLHHFTQLNDQGLTAGPYEINVLVPEPGTLLALAVGLLGAAAWSRRKTE